MDSITITTAPTLLLTKRWHRDVNGQLVATNYGNAKHLIFQTAPVDGIRDLARILQSMSSDPHSAVVRGEPKKSVLGKLSRRLLRDRVDAKATLDPCPRRWVLLDFDTIPAPPGIDYRRDPQTLVRHAISYLPASFGDVSCWWAFTSGMGIKPGLRIRLAFWLDRPLGGQDLKSWLQGSPVDVAVFRDAQLIYVASPLFADPTDDPFCGVSRSGVLEGSREVVETPSPTLLVEVARSPGNVTRDVSAKPAGDWRDVLSEIGDGEARNGFYDPIKNALGRFFQKNGSSANPAPLREALVDAIKHAPRDKALHDDDYPLRRIADLDGWIAWTRDRQADTEAVEEARRSNAEDRWTTTKIALDAGASAFDTWAMVWFNFPRMRPSIVRETQQAHEIALQSWRERKAQWEDLRDFTSDTDPFEDTFPEASPTAPTGYDKIAIKVTAGVGKTTAVIRELSDRLKCNAGERAFYAVPNHAKCAEVVDEFAKHGLTARIWQGFGFPPDNPSCRRAVEAQKVVDAGGSLIEMCGTCAFHPKRGGDCAYQLQRHLKPEVWVVPHATLQFEPRMVDKVFDWGVIDESYSVSAERDAIHIDELCSIEQGRGRNSRSYENAIARLQQILRKHSIGPINRDAFIEFTADACRAFSKSAMIDHLSPLDVGPDLIDACAIQNRRVVRRSRFWRILGDFLAGDHQSSGRLTWTGSECVMQAPRPIADGWRQCHLLLLDATLDARIAQQWLPGVQLWAEIDVENTGKVRFVRNPPVSFNKIIPSSTSPDTLRTQENNLRRIWHRIEAEAGARAVVGEAVLAIMPKGAEDWIRGHYEGSIPSNLHIDHFGNLRGVNRYERVAKAIVVSRTQPTAREIERLTAALFDRPVEPLPSEFLGKRARLLKMRDGTARAIDIDHHSDPNAQALLEQIREAEVEQAAHRLRPVRRQCEIDLVSIVPVNVTVDEVVDFEDWLDEGGAVALALARGVLPETTTQFARVISDVCSDRKALEHHFRQNPAARAGFEGAIAAAKAVKTPIFNLIY